MHVSSTRSCNWCINFDIRVLWFPNSNMYMYLKTIFPALSAFHALTRAKSPRIASSITYMLPSNSFTCVHNIAVYITHKSLFHNIHVAIELFYLWSQHSCLYNTQIASSITYILPSNSFTCGHNIEVIAHTNYWISMLWVLCNWLIGILMWCFDFQIHWLGHHQRIHRCALLSYPTVVGIRGFYDNVVSGKCEYLCRPIVFFFVQSFFQSNTCSCIVLMFQVLVHVIASVKYYMSYYIMMRVVYSSGDKNLIILLLEK